MKKGVIILSVILVALACKKESEDGGGGAPPADLVVGNWLLDELEFEGETDFMGTPIPISGEGKNITGGYNLNADGTMDYDYSCDLEISALQMSLPFSASGSGTWEKNGQEITLNDTQTGSQTYDIKAVTNNILILEQDTVINQGGVMAELELDITLRK